MKNIIEFLGIDNTNDNWRYSLNISMGSGGESCYQYWINHKNDTSFARWSHYGNEKSIGIPKRNYQKGFKNLGFVRLPGSNDEWLLVEASEIIDVPELDKNKNGSACKINPISKYQKYIGKLKIKYFKGNKYSRYVFKLSSSGDKLKVIDSKEN